MAVRTDFVAGEVLAAQDLDDTFASKVNYALPVNPQTGSGASAYTFALADGLRLTTASNAAASTYTIPPQVSVAWLANSVIRIVNYGAGVVTIAGGAGVTVTNATKTLSQFESAALIRTASNAWTLVPFGGASRATYSATTGSPTITTVSGKTCIQYNSSGSITINNAGLLNCLILAGGGGGGGSLTGYDASSGGGGAGGYIEESIFLAAGTYTVQVGAGGAGGAERAVGSLGTLSFVGPFASVQGGGGGGLDQSTWDSGASGGGGGRIVVGSGASGRTSTIATQGKNGGNGGSENQGGGGGGGASGNGGNFSTTTGGAGGAGVSSSITGSAVARAGGGGGGGSVTGGTATSGGGNGGTSAQGSAGTANRGGGGGGSNRATNGGAGGSGQVILLIG